MSSRPLVIIAILVAVGFGFMKLQAKRKAAMAAAHPTASLASQVQRTPTTAAPQEGGVAKLNAPCHDAAPVGKHGAPRAPCRDATAARPTEHLVTVTRPPNERMHGVEPKVDVAGSTSLSPKQLLFHGADVRQLGATDAKILDEKAEAALRSACAQGSCGACRGLAARTKQHAPGEASACRDAPQVAVHMPTGPGQGFPRGATTPVSPVVGAASFGGGSGFAPPPPH